MKATKTTTITLNRRILDAGQAEAKRIEARGGFSGYVENLIKEDLEKKNIPVDKSNQ